jgi:PAT family beta-lactamase induction signal transducer AmpG
VADPEPRPPSPIELFFDRRVVTMLFLGFSAGIPLLLIFSSLSLWLREAGAERAAVTYFSWAALGYSFKFVWAPLVDQLSVPGLTARLGRRRAWMLVAQVIIIMSILSMAMIDPSSTRSSLTLMALAAVMLGFSSATQDIVIDAYRIESAEPELQAMMSATYIAGYRAGGGRRLAVSRRLVRQQ